jgi:hypothetical protein
MSKMKFKMPRSKPIEIGKPGVKIRNSDFTFNIIPNYSFAEFTPDQKDEFETFSERRKKSSKRLEEGRKDSSSIGKNILELMSTSYKLIRDSFQSFNSMP